MKKNLLLCAFAISFVLVSGCSLQSSGQVYVIDLNKVLEIFEKVLNEPLPANTADAGEKKDEGKDDSGAAKNNQLAEVEESKANTEAFLTEFAKQLNDAKLIDKPISVRFKTNGAIAGFVKVDGEAGGQKEKELFEIQVDKEGNRLVASDKDGNHHRDRPYRYRPGGFFTGYMLGSMLSRQNNYYSGTRTRPNFSAMKMSPKNYHSSAVSQAKTRMRKTSSARTKGGSRGFSFGK